MAHTPTMLAAAAPFMPEATGVDPALDALLAGLQAHPARIDPKYLYDALGSSLFAAITQLPEYYPTRCEAEIFATHLEAIARHTGPVRTLIDLGAGDCAKAERLLPCLRPQRYVPIDISTDFLGQAVARVRRAHPWLDVLPLGRDLNAGLDLPKAIDAQGRLFFYPGSSIGNLDPDAALALLASLRAQAGVSGGLLIGVDRVKARAIVEPAYDDALHLTGAFNLNLLRHVNSVLGSDFDVRDWTHVALYNEPRSRMEMHLQARSDIRVRWPGGQRRFQADERIHTENSYKYTIERFVDLLRRAGYGDIRHWSDARDWFSVFSARA